MRFQTRSTAVVYKERNKPAKAAQKPEAPRNATEMRLRRFPFERELSELRTTMVSKLGVGGGVGTMMCHVRSKINFLYSLLV